MLLVVECRRNVAQRMVEKKIAVHEAPQTLATSVRRRKGDRRPAELLHFDDHVNARLSIDTRHELLWLLLVTSNAQSDNPFARLLFDRSHSPLQWLREATIEKPAESDRLLGRRWFPA